MGDEKKNISKELYFNIEIGNLFFKFLDEIKDKTKFIKKPGKNMCFLYPTLFWSSTRPRPQVTNELSLNLTEFNGDIYKNILQDQLSKFYGSNIFNKDVFQPDIGNKTFKGERSLSSTIFWNNLKKLRNALDMLQINYEDFRGWRDRLYYMIKVVILAVDDDELKNNAHIGSVTGPGPSQGSSTGSSTGSSSGQIRSTTSGRGTVSSSGQIRSTTSGRGTVSSSGQIRSTTSGRVSGPRRGDRNRKSVGGSVSSNRNRKSGGWLRNLRKTRRKKKVKKHKKSHWKWLSRLQKTLRKK